MTGWTLHWLEAEGDLQPWRAAIEREIDAARDAIARIVPLSRLDILIQRVPGHVIPEIGMGGHSWRRSLLSVTLDPDNPNFETALADQALRRTVAHEVHHCLRMAALSYGATLGEALVSEGLAGQFVSRLFQTAPKPWECAVDEASLRAHYPSDAELGSTEYDHNAWFYGTKGQRYPRWLGYTLGFRIVGAWLAGSQAAGGTWVTVPAAEVLSATRGIFDAP